MIEPITEQEANLILIHEENANKKVPKKLRFIVQKSTIADGERDLLIEDAAALLEAQLQSYKKSVEKVLEHGQVLSTELTDLMSKADSPSDDVIGNSFF